MTNSELILNDDGSIYHLNLLPQDIANTIILVGDPQRVGKISKHFDHIEVTKQKREFVTHTGTYQGKRITVISTGIGAGNIDITMNELDALKNVNLNTGEAKKSFQPIQFIRIGTSGCLVEDIPVDSYLLSTAGIGLDGLLLYYSYQENKQEKSIREEVESTIHFPVKPYVIECSSTLLNHFAQQNIYQGITVTCSGFYGPQGRTIRLTPQNAQFLDQLTAIGNGKITNLEMETAVIYGLAKCLGHQAISINLLLANRKTKTFSPHPKQAMEQMIVFCLEKITTLR